MKARKTLKKLSAIIMAFVMLFGAFGGNITAKASNSPVKMYYCDHVINWRGSIQYIVYIQIDARSAVNKAVYVHYGSNSSGWRDIPATFVDKIDDNTEIWKATISGSGEYAIKYIGDGQTYWDNNNGNNYTYDDILGAANIIVERLTYQSGGSFTVQVIVKNLSYDKVVGLRYTLDNWATFSDMNLRYLSSIPDTDLERWSITLNLPESLMDSFQYCVYYQVNGLTYWDNNFGANYDRSYYKPLGY